MLELVLVFYLYFLKGKNWYWYFIAKIKHARIGIGILLVYKSLQCPTLMGANLATSLVVLSVMVVRASGGMVSQCNASIIESVLVI